MLNIEFDSGTLGDILSEHVEEAAVYDPTQATFHRPKGDEPARLQALSAALVWNDDVTGGAL